MTPRARPLLYLAEPPTHNTVLTSKVSILDHLILLSTFILVVAGAVITLDHASARSTGMDAQSMDWLVNISSALSTFGQLLGEYTALLGAGLLSITVIVAFVVGLRMLDSLQASFQPKIQIKESGSIQFRDSTTQRVSRTYLLAPVFQ